MKISIITVCLNSEKTIKDTLNSLYKDNNVEFEHIIVDGYSKDNTINIVNDFKDKRTKIYFKEPQGIYDAMNFGVSKCNGDFVYFLNSDDYLKKGVLKEVQKHCNKEIDMIYGNVKFFYPEENNYVKIIRIASIRHLKNGNMPQHQSCFVNKNLALNYLFNVKYNIVADYDFFCNIFKYNLSIIYLNKIIAVVRIGGKSSNLKKTWKQQEKVIKNHFGFYYWFLIKIKHLFFGFIKIINNKLGVKIHKG
jgi:glycosyltransferase